MIVKRSEPQGRSKIWQARRKAFTSSLTVLRCGFTAWAPPRSAATSPNTGRLWNSHRADSASRQDGEGFPPPLPVWIFWKFRRNYGCLVRIFWKFFYPLHQIIWQLYGVPLNCQIISYPQFFLNFLKTFLQKNSRLEKNPKNFLLTKSQNSAIIKTS